MMSSETFKIDSKTLGKTKRSDDTASVASSNHSVASRPRTDESEPSPKKLMLRSGYSTVEAPVTNGITSGSSNNSTTNHHNNVDSSSSHAEDNNNVIHKNNNKKIKNNNNNNNNKNNSNKNNNNKNKDDDDNGDNDDADDDEDNDDESSVGVPDGQYEVEQILDYTREKESEMYLVKWRGWDEDFNTWEPPPNLVNCDSALIALYRERRQQFKLLASQSEQVVSSSGKITLVGARIPFQIPPNPLPFPEQVKEFFELHGQLTDEEIDMGRKKYSKKKFDNRLLAGSNKKLTKVLADGMEGRLADVAMKSLRKQLVDLEFIRRREEHKKILQNWHDSINSITEGRPTITIENDIDWAGPPEDFVYTNDYVVSADVVVPDDPPPGSGCECTNCFENKKGCSAAHDATFAYKMDGRLTVPVGTPIYECNKTCACPPDCPNRVVQDGQKSMVNKRFCIFRTDNGRGWGVKTLTKIKKGSFVTLYVGEVVTTDEAERRGRSYDAEGCTYLFDLDFNDQELYTVDAAKHGNIAHFINHSCDPNLAVWPVWVDWLDPNLPKLALFAIYDIDKGEEITFDYKNLVDDKNRLNNSLESEEGTTARPLKNTKPCYCGTKECKGTLF